MIILLIWGGHNPIDKHQSNAIRHLYILLTTVQKACSDVADTLE